MRTFSVKICSTVAYGVVLPNAGNADGADVVRQERAAAGQRVSAPGGANRRHQRQQLPSGHDSLLPLMRTTIETSRPLAMTTLFTSRSLK